MKNNTLKMDFKSFFKHLLFLCLLLVLGNSKAFSQCTYVTKAVGKETKLNIPCDFPVNYNTETSGRTNQKNFDAEIRNWIKLNPLVKDLVFVPTSLKATNCFIQIPFSEYSKFDLKRKQAIDKVSDFYIIVNQTK